MKNKKSHSPKIISWQAPEFSIHKKNPGWYLGFILISVALIIFAIISKSIITIITFSLLIIIVYFFSTQSPRTVTHTVSASGISVGEQLYPHKNIKSFWIVYHPPEVKTLNFETTAYLNNQVTLQLDKQDPVAVKLFLEQYLIEDLDREESLTDIISRNIKF